MNKLWDNILNSILLLCLLSLLMLGVILCIALVIHLASVLW